MAPHLLTASDSPIILSIDNEVAILTLNLPHKKNALSLELYRLLASLLIKVDAMPDVLLTILTGAGDFFSAGADVKAVRDDVSSSLPVEQLRANALARAAEGNMNLGRALYSHRKILVAALNGPAVGLSAALLGHFDLIYAVPGTYLLTPFTTLALVCEGGASETFPARLGRSLAFEALVMGNKLTADRLVQAGFFNQVVDVKSGELLGEVVRRLRDTFEGKDVEACLISKKLIKQAMPDPDTTNAREILEAADRFATGRPQAQFAAIANKKVRHKL